ncbi:MAG: phosphotransferase [Thermoplasmatota archaeon]
MNARAVEAVEAALEGAAEHLACARWSGCAGAGGVELRALVPLFERGGASFFAAILSFPPDPEPRFVPVVASRAPVEGLRPLRTGSGLYLAESEPNPAFLSFVIESMRRGRVSEGRGGRVVWRGVRVPRGAVGAARPLGGDTSNALVSFRAGRRRAVLKSYRRLDPFNPEPELLDFLSRRKPAVAPRVLGGALFVPEGGARAPLHAAVLMEHVEGSPALPAFVGNSRRAILRRLPCHPCMPGRLGEALAELHRLLSSDRAPPELRPGEIEEDDVARWRDGVRRDYASALGALRGRARARLERAGAGLEEFLSEMSEWVGGLKLRTHQDMHLAQVLICRGGFRFLDFEGEPMRRGPSRRERLPPARDVAGMLRSFSYASEIALREVARMRGRVADAAGGAAPLRRAPETGEMERRARDWEKGVSGAFVKGYLSSCPGAVRRGGMKRFMAATRVWMVQKGLYEILYEARHRPSWVGIPLRGVLEMLEGA